MQCFSTHYNKVIHDIFSLYMILFSIVYIYTKTIVLEIVTEHYSFIQEKYYNLS